MQASMLAYFQLQQSKKILMKTNDSGCLKNEFNEGGIESKYEFYYLS